MARRLPFLLLALTLTGCFAHGFNRPAIYSRLQEESVQVTDEQIAKWQAVKPQLAFPCRIAVCLSPTGRARWTGKDKEIIESWGEKLKKEGIAADMFLMSDMFTTGKTLTDLRASAARHGAQALLVLQGDYDVDSHLNPAAVLNLTIIGGFIVPAAHRDALFVLQGGLVDVGNGYLYATIEAEGEGRIVRPSFVVEEKPAVEKAKQKALANFGPELLKRLRAVHANHAPQAVVRATQPGVAP